jgi:hypothetical protein
MAGGSLFLALKQEINGWSLYSANKMWGHKRQDHSSIKCRHNRITKITETPACVETLARAAKILTLSLVLPGFFSIITLATCNIFHARSKCDKKNIPKIPCDSTEWGKGTYQNDIDRLYFP